MENMDKGLTVPKWVLINWTKMHQMPQNLSAKFVCPRTKIWGFYEKRLYRASVVREKKERNAIAMNIVMKKKEI